MRSQLPQPKAHDEPDVFDDEYDDYEPIYIGIVGAVALRVASSTLGTCVGVAIMHWVGVL